jgi:hypothetical protein
MAEMECPSSWRRVIRVPRSLRKWCRGRYALHPACVRRWSYSRAYELPKGTELMFLAQTRYPVIMVNLVFSLPRKKSPLHLPIPVKSWKALSEERGAILLLVNVVVPPAWQLSVSGIGSISELGELKDTHDFVRWPLAREVNADLRCECAQAVFVSAIPVMLESMDDICDR